MNLLSRFLRAMLMLVVLAVDTPVLPSVLAACAEMDGEHEVRVIQSAGHLQVVLHHRDGEETLLPGDHSSQVARLLCELSSLNEERDHEFGFSSSSGPAQFERRVSIANTSSSAWIVPPSVDRALPLALSSKSETLPLKPPSIAEDRGRLETLLRTPQQSHGAMSLLV